MLRNKLPKRVRAPFIGCPCNIRQLWYPFIESGCLRVQPKVGGILHLKLNIDTRPIANKYREGKMKRTLKREWNSAWNRWKGSWWGAVSRTASILFQTLLKVSFDQCQSGQVRFRGKDGCTMLVGASECVRVAGQNCVWVNRYGVWNFTVKLSLWRRKLRARATAWLVCHCVQYGWHFSEVPVVSCVLGALIMLWVL